MKDFALIIHPINPELLQRYEPGMKNRPHHLVKQVLKWMSPFKASEVVGLSSIEAGKREGYLVMCPLLMEQMVSLNPKFILKAIINTAKFAEKLDVKMIGLTAFTSLVGNRGVDIAKELHTPITSGNACTVAMIPETVLRAAKAMDVELDKSEVLIIGATNDIGKMCIEILGRSVKRLYLRARSKERVKEVIKSASSYLKADLVLIEEIDKIIKRVNIVIVASNGGAAVFDVKKLSPGTVVLDASYPRQIPTDIRDDILITDGLAMKPPGDVKFNFDFGLPEGLAFPCMAETLALALDNRYESFSLGKHIPKEKVMEIFTLANRHGFEISNFTSLERIIDNEKIIEIKKKAFKKNNSKNYFFVFKYIQ